MFVEESGIVTLDDAELAKLNTIRVDKIDGIRVIDGGISKFVSEAAEIQELKYHQLIWKVTGDVHFGLIMKGYTRLLSEYPYLRSNFITGILEQDVMVTYKAEDMAFPITDVLDLPKSTQLEKIVNAAAAETRKTYNLMRSPALRIQGLLLKQNELAVIISFIPQLCKNISRGSLAQYIFPDMNVEEGKNTLISSSANVLNDKIEKENIDYWKNEISSGINPVTFPVQNSDSNLISSIESVQKSLDGDIYESIKKYVHKKNVSTKAFIVYSWLSFLGKVMDEDNPSILMTGKYDEPKFYPVSLYSCVNPEEGLNYINGKIASARNHGYIRESHYSQLFDDEFIRKFKIQLNIIDMNEIGENDNWLRINNELSADEVELKIQCYYSNKDCYFNYTYNAGVYYGDTVSIIHEKMVEYMKSVVTNVQTIINASGILSNRQNVEEYKRRLLLLCQKSLTNTSVFRFCDEDQISVLADKCTVKKLTMDDEIMVEGEVADSIYIVTSGNIEESTIDRNGIEKTLRIVSKYNILGIEALSNQNVVRRTYSVAGNEAVVVKIPAADVEKLLENNPKLWKHILQITFDRLGSMERIWLSE